MRGLPLLARLDGRAFHTFTRDLRRPYEQGMSIAMIEEDARRRLAAGEAGFLDKPYAVDTLLHAVSRALRDAQHGLLHR